MKRESNMLDPSMSQLLHVVDNRYLLVNITARLAREISQKSEESGEKLENKPVTIALHEIADGEVKIVPTERNNQ